MGVSLDAVTADTAAADGTGLTADEGAAGVLLLAMIDFGVAEEVEAVVKGFNGVVRLAFSSSSRFFLRSRNAAD